MNSHDDDIREQKRMGLTMQAFAWVVLLCLGVFYFGDVLDRQHNPNRSPDTAYLQGGVREVVLQRNRQGHYVAGGEINGYPVTFLLDTGATGVAVPMGLAERIGIPRGAAFPTRTANGISTSYAASLDSVSLGDIELRGVSAGITPGLTGEEVLLGMSFLKHIEFTQRGDTLILRQ